MPAPVAPPVNVSLYEKAALPDGSFRCAGYGDDGRIHVGVWREGEASFKAKISFEINEALRRAEACLAGDQRALTEPGLTRILCGALLVLGKAAFWAGVLEAERCDDFGDRPDLGHRDDAAGDEPAD
jgi:hypothetical protein